MFGDEKLARQKFTKKLINWRHANGSEIYKIKNNDGKEYIQKIIMEHEYKLIITFGRPAMQIFFKENLEDMIHTKFVSFSQLNGKVKFANKQFNTLECKNYHTPIAILPHTSGRGQNLWKKKAKEISDLLISLQSKTKSIVV